MLKALSVLILAVSLCFTETSCVQRVPLTTAQTAQLNSAQAIGIIAEVNKQVSSLAQQMNASGSLATETTRSILEYTTIVANAGKAATVVQQSSKTDTEKATAVLALMKQLTLPASLQAFVDAPGAAGQAATLVTLIKATVAQIQVLTGGK